MRLQLLRMHSTTTYVQGQIFPTYLKFLTPVCLVLFTLQVAWLYDQDKMELSTKIVFGPVLKAIELNA